MKFICHIVLLFYFFLPFQFALNLTDNFDVAIIRILSLTIFGLYLTISLYNKYIFIPKGWIASLLFCFFMWIYFSFFFTPVPDWTLRKVLYFSSFFPLFIVLTALLHAHKNFLLHMIKALVYGSFFISLITIMQFVLQFIIPLNSTLMIWSHISPYFLGNTFASSVAMYNSWLVHVGNVDLMRGIAFFPDPHIASFYFGIISPFAAGLYYHTHKWHFLFLTIFIIIADLLTFSRGGYFGLLAGALCAMILFWPRLHTKIRHFIILLCITFIFILCIPQNPVSQRFLSSFDSSDASVTQRVELWSQALAIIAQNPFLGTGLGAYPFIVSPQADYRTPIYAHNIYLDIFAELGLLGFMTFFGSFLIAIYIFLRNKDSLFSYFAIISIVIFSTHAIFDTPIYSVHILPILLLILAIAAHYENLHMKSMCISCISHI